MRSCEFIIEHDVKQPVKRQIENLTEGIAEEKIKAMISKFYQKLSKLPGFVKQFKKAQANKPLINKIMQELLDANKDGRLTKDTVINITKSNLLVTEEEIKMSGVDNFKNLVNQLMKVVAFLITLVFGLGINFVVGVTIPFLLLITLPLMLAALIGVGAEPMNVWTHSPKTEQDISELNWLRQEEEQAARDAIQAAEQIIQVNRDKVAQKRRESQQQTFNKIHGDQRIVTPAGAEAKRIAKQKAIMLPNQGR